MKTFIICILLVTFFSETETMATNGKCAPVLCNYDTMKPPLDLLVPIDWRTLQVGRACSCAGYCAFYGDCCSDALAISRHNLESILLRRNWSKIRRLRDRMKPTCGKLKTGPLERNTPAPSFIYTHIAAECNDCYVGDIIDYTGANATEIMQRLPVYHKDLGIVFSSMNCARCYQDDLLLPDMKTKVLPLPLIAMCSSSIIGNASADGTTQCQYSLNISELQDNFPKIALCIPIVEDIYMQEDFACAGVDNLEERHFSACNWENATTGLLYLNERPNEVFKMCTSENEWTNLCGDDANRTALLQNPPTCVQKGSIPITEMGVPVAMLAEPIQRRSDFSYRYMFDLHKLAIKEDTMHAPEAVMCAGGGREIFIERWRLCVSRSQGEIIIGVQPYTVFAPVKVKESSTLPDQASEQEKPQSEREWLDFSNSFFDMREDENSTVLEKGGDPNFKLESQCFRYNMVTSHFLVSYRCLCEIFRKSAQFSVSSSLTQSIIPNQDDDRLSLAGSVSIWVSLACLLIVIVVLSTFQKLRNRPAKLVILLSIFLFIGMLMILVNIYVDVTVVRPRHKKEPTYEENCLRSPPWKEAICNLIGTSLHFSYLATFALASALYIDLWRSVRQSSVPGQHTESWKRFYALAVPSCMIPLVIVLIAVAIDQLSPDHDFAPRYAEFVCWISEPNALFAFFVCPVVVCLIVDIVFFVLIVRQIRTNSFRPPSVSETGTSSSTVTSSTILKVKSKLKSQVNEEAKRRSREEKRQKYIRRLGIYVKMALMMGLTWLIGCIAPFIPEEYEAGLVLWYAFVILNGLQGVFIFYTYVLNKRTVKIIRETCASRNSQEQARRQRAIGGHAPTVTDSSSNTTKKTAAKRVVSDSKLLVR